MLTAATALSSGSGLAAAATPATVLASDDVSAAAATPALQEIVDREVQAAANDGIQQSVAVVDRTTGKRLASAGGTEHYISESIVKLFTVAYYAVQHDGHPDQNLTDALQYMIIHSDDHIESELWSTDIVPSMAARYHLAHTSNGPKTGPHDWGWELITADDEADFLYRMSKDPEVAPILLPAMREVAPTGNDGFDQSFGLNSLSGDHGSKQGWTDVGSSNQVQIHSVGWVGRYFVAILQTSTGTGYDTMRADSTRTAQAVAATLTARPATPTPSSRAATPPPAELTNAERTEAREFGQWLESFLRRALSGSL